MEIETVAEAEKAISTFDGTTLGGREIKVAEGAAASRAVTGLRRLRSLVAPECCYQGDETCQADCEL